MAESIPVMCPYCGEMSDLTVEDEGWSRQSFVQDCPVCCRPNAVRVEVGKDGDVRVWAERE